MIHTDTIAAIATAMIAAAIFLSIFICRTSNVK